MTTLDQSQVALLEKLAARYSSSLGKDAAAYLGHVRRVLIFSEMLRGSPLEERDVVAGFFHDLGIWTDATNDYLPPSVREACGYLEETGHAEWADEVAAMIEWHHKLSPYVGAHAERVEAFRKADLVDFSFGLLRSGLPRSSVSQVFAADPPWNFRRFLLRITLLWPLQHPLRPFPVFRR